MPRFATCLIETNAIVREGLKSVLIQAHDYELVLETDSVERLADSTKCDLVDIALIGITCDDRIIETRLKKVRQIMPSAYVLILMGSISPECVAKAFAAGANGVLKNDVSTAALPVYLNLIMLGENVMPSALASQIATKQDISSHQNSSMNDNHLSTREIEIIRCLADGEPNKIIARHLDITEATVKVHIKTILRKLGLNNRTQAALWAIQHNLGKAHGADVVLEANDVVKLADANTIKQHLPIKNVV